MATKNVGLQEVMDLASHLSPSQQKLLVSFLEASGTGEVVCGSPAAILRALGDPPHVSSEDVNELEREIAAGKVQVQQEGTFDKGDQG